MSTPPSPVTPSLPLPSWSDPASVVSYFASLLATVFAIVTAVHPGYQEPAIVTAVLPAVGAVVAGVVQIVNVVTHRSTTAKIYAAAVQAK